MIILLHTGNEHRMFRRLWTMCIPIFTFNKSLSRYVVEIAGVTRLIVLISNLCKIDTQNGQFIVTQTHTRRQPFLEKGDPKTLYISLSRYCNLRCTNGNDSKRAFPPVRTHASRTYPFSKPKDYFPSERHIKFNRLH